MDAPRWLTAGPSRETNIRRDALGRWFDGEQPLAHPNLARAFDAWIDVSPDGRYRLSNAVDWAYVEIEGAPLFVRAVVLVGPRIDLVLSDGRREQLDPSTLRQGPDGALYCAARGGRLAARFDRSAVQQLEPVIDADDEGPFLLVDGAAVRPPIVQDPLPNPSPTSYKGGAHEDR